MERTTSSAGSQAKYCQSLFADSIVSLPSSELIIDVSYQKSTGSITGWYYHKNSEMYAPPLVITNDRNQKLTLKVFTSFLKLTHSIAREYREDFPFTSFDDMRTIINLMDLFLDLGVGINAFVLLLFTLLFLFRNKTYITYIRTTLHVPPNLIGKDITATTDSVSPC